MKLLLDTCTFLWIVLDAPALSESARASFQDPSNEAFLSAVSAWEISVKFMLGRLPLPEDPKVYIPRMREAHGISPLALDEISALHLVRLPPLHRDPFDRMLVCQALVHGMLLLTPDERIKQYPTLCAW